MKWLRRLRYWMNREDEAAALAEEMEFHRAMLDRDGSKPSDFGNSAIASEDARRVWIWPWVESVEQDVRYALRNLRSHPGFAAAAIVAVALGLGVNSSLFSAFSAVALRPWPVHDPGRVVTAYSLLPRAIGGKGRYAGFSIAEARHLKEHARTVAGLEPYRAARVQLGFEAAGEYSKGCLVGGGFFEMLGVGMSAGRGFLQEEDIAGSPVPVVVLSHRMWRNQFGSDTHLVGKQVRINDMPFTIVGILPERFQGIDLMDRDVWLPMAAYELLAPEGDERRSARKFLESPGDCCSNVAARIAPGVTREAAEEELNLIHRHYAKEIQLDRAGIMIRGTENFGTPGMMKAIPLLGLFGIATLLVLVLACANVGNLMLARAAARQQEIAMRRSLGASRPRLIRQLLTESALLAGMAGMVAFAIAWFLPDLLVRHATGTNPPMRFTPDLDTALFTVLLSFGASLLFGLIPALQATRDLSYAARSRRSSGGVLLAVQIGISVVLLANAGILIRAVERARDQNPGFAIQGRSIVALQFPATSYDAARRHSVAYESLEQLRSLSAVKSAGLTEMAPLGNATSGTSYRLPHEDAATGRMVRVHRVSEGYVRALGIAMLAGRDLERTDEERGRILVNQSLANRHWPDESAVGKFIVTGHTTREIVGVVGDAYLDGWETVPPSLFEPFKSDSTAYALIDSVGEMRVEVLRAAIQRVDPRVQMSVSPLSVNLERHLKPVMSGAEIAAMLGTLALVLASVGIFGAFSYIVQRRTREIGIRMAIGARPGQVVLGVLGGSGVALCLGLCAGLAGAVPLARVLRSQFATVEPFDLPALAGVILILVTAALVASYAPARRAARVDPMQALRTE